MLDIIKDSYSGYFSYLKSEVLYLSWHNYFYYLIFISVLVWILELLFPWRKSQAVFRKDFWLDGFYMFFNFFIFSLIGYNALSNIGVEIFNSLIGKLGLKNIVALNIQSWPTWCQFALMFVVADFIQWNIHRLLHKNKFLWEFHKVHHSVEQMGFAAHLRFHWMETIIYKSIQYIPLMMIGFGIQDFFIVHMITIAIGHLNHANLRITYGPFKYILNNPVMHLWHHAYHQPEGKSGVNFGLSLSVWDYIFGTAYIPEENPDVKLGFEEIDKFPSSFWKQSVIPYKNK